MCQPPLNGLMLDTNVFNRVADGLLSLSAFDGYTIFATHVQLDELRNTAKNDRRVALLACFREINALHIPTESMVWDVSAWDECKWTSDDLCERIFAEIRKVERPSKSDDNCWRDALIADTAIKCFHALITDDGNLRKIVKRNHGSAMSISELLSVAKSAHV